MSERITEIAVPSKKQKLAEVAATPVRYAWWQDRSLPGYRLRAVLPHGCNYEADYYKYGPGHHEVRRLVTSVFRVNEELQDNGIGKRLMKASLFVAKQGGALQSSAAVDNPLSLFIRRSIFGEDNMTNVLSGERKLLSVDEAVCALVGRSCLLGEYQVLTTSSDLELLDTTGWEVPVQVSYEDLEPWLRVDEPA